MNKTVFSKEILLNALNPEQQEVVTHSKGPLLVLAGAGSGKTRCVIHRVAWLISQEFVNPWNILVVTFTNKAASELRNRLENLFNYKMKSAWVGTFHSVCTKILRFEIKDLADYTSDFTIFNRDDQLSLLKKIYPVLNIDKKKIPPEKVLNIISKQKSSLILPEDFFQYKEKTENNELFHKLYSRYNDLLKKENAMDFDDLLLNTALLLKNNAEIRSKYQKMFQYIMIDEYQDTNFVQFYIMKQLAQGHQNICVVGDDDQAIYGWRGANIKNILSFHKDYDEVKIVKLERNYRSSQNILTLANQLIEKNTNRHDKKLWSDNNYNHLPELISHDNEQAEANFIAEEVLSKINNDINPNEIVILYRTNFQSRIFESVFATRNIPYQVIGSFSFFKRAEIKDMLAWLRFLLNPDDMEACLRIINTPPRGIGKTSIDHLIKFTFNNDLTIIQALQNVEHIDVLKPAAKKSFKSFYVLVKNIYEMSKNLKVPEIIRLIIDECDLYNYYKILDSKEMTDKVENIQEFISAATEFDLEYQREYQESPTLADYLNSLSLQSDVDELDNKKESVKLMTMHCAKGLEFEFVYLAGLEEGILPHILCLDQKSEIEEERRLLYVGITRAKKEVQLHYAHSRRMAGKPQYQNSSRFLRDFDESAFNRFNASFYEPRRPESNFTKKITKLNQFYPVLESDKFFKIGQTVNHEDYGKGTILSVDGDGEDAKLTISFDNGSLKKIQGKWVTYD